VAGRDGEDEAAATDGSGSDIVSTEHGGGRGIEDVFVQGNSKAKIQQKGKRKGKDKKKLGVRLVQRKSMQTK
jgi:hypothetical protein